MPLVDPRGDWFQTNSGIKFHVLDPRQEDIDITDIAHALSVKPRFGGHLDRQFTIAQHSLVVSRIVPKEFALEGLLHDCSEAYLPDVVSPVKNVLSQAGINYRDLVEDKVERAIFQRFGLEFPLTGEAKFAIKKADWISVLIEHELFIDKKQAWENVPYEKYNIKLEEYDVSLWQNIQKMSQEDVKSAFLQSFKYLAKERFGLDCLPKYFNIRSLE